MRATMKFEEAGKLSMDEGDLITIIDGRSVGRLGGRSGGRAVGRAVGRAGGRSGGRAGSRSISISVSISVSIYVSQSIGISAGQSESLLVSHNLCQSVNRNLYQSVGQSVSRSVGQSVSRSVGQSVSQSAALTVGQLVSKSTIVYQMVVNTVAYYNGKYRTCCTEVISPFRLHVSVEGASLKRVLFPTAVQLMIRSLGLLIIGVFSLLSSRRPENYYWTGQNKRTCKVGQFPRALMHPQRRKTG